MDREAPWWKGGCVGSGYRVSREAWALSPGMEERMLGSERGREGEASTEDN